MPDKMPAYDASLLLTLQSKSECLTDAFRDYEKQAYIELLEEPNLAVLEVAGRDSAAAAVVAAKSGEFSAFLPTIAYTSTEYGDWMQAIRCAEFIRERIDGVKIYPTIAIGSAELWRAINGRYMSRIINQYGAYSPCPGCHLYLHLIRIPIAWQTAAKTVISGERISHDGAVKINQTRSVLDIYRQVLDRANIELLMPIENISDGALVRELIGEAWEEGDRQLGCVFSSNYKNEADEIIVDENAIIRFLEEFSVPFANRVIEHWVQGRTIDYDKIAKKIAEETR